MCCLNSKKKQKGDKMTCSLVLIGGLWFNPCNVVTLEPKFFGSCGVFMVNHQRKIDLSCEEVKELLVGGEVTQ